MKSALPKWLMAEKTEFDLIEKYFTPESWRKDVVLGVGDDCAVLQAPNNKQLAVTVDTLIAGVHFPLETSAADIAYKSLAVSLSDLAAMGAEPAWATLALTLPEVDDRWLTEFSRSFLEILKQYNVQLVGGDTTSGALSITVHATGFVEDGAAMWRSSAKPGDSILVTGTLGDASLGLLLQDRVTSHKHSAFFINKLNRPEPRACFSQQASRYINAAIDVSDGLIADLNHILKASDCGAELSLADVPLSDELLQYFNDEKKPLDWDMILTGGDDYELCMTVAPAEAPALVALTKSMGLRLTCIGEIKSGQSLSIKDVDAQEYVLNNTGYDHFHHD
jgi:thiamine-monophosphate kinase